MMSGEIHSNGNTSHKLIIFKQGATAHGTLAAGGGTTIVHENVQQGKELSPISLPSQAHNPEREGRTTIVMEKPAVAKTVHINMDHSITVNYDNDGEQQFTEARTVFHRRRQESAESTSDFANALRQLGASCNFGSILKKELLTQFISGLQSEAIRGAIERNSTQNFDLALGIAIGMEGADN